jgi:hypothetical protein
MEVLDKSGNVSKLRSSPLTQRDKDILRTIYEFDGMMGAEQIQKLFFTSWYRTRLRLAKLYSEGYINHPDRKMRAALPQMIYWLTKKGARVVAGTYGKSLTGDGFKWRQKVRWSLVPHDLEANDFRIAVMLACEQLGNMALTEWIPSGEFWARPDRIEYEVFDKKVLKRGVRPDGYFVLHNREIGRNTRFLLELDKDSNEDLRRIADEKVLPGLAYLASESYQRRAHWLPGEKLKSGRWLFVISTANADLRLSNMKRRIEQITEDNAGKFWLTTLSEVKECENVLTSPIWSRGGQDGKVSLLG